MHEPIWVNPPHPASIDEAELLKQCRMSKQRTGGPGGQHRNKVETAVNLIHEPTGQESHAGERRSVTENHRVALRRLRLMLAMGVRCEVPAGDCRSELWRSRCDARGRVACNPEHHDYPALLAEALDMLWACGLDPAKAALRLCCTGSQLVRLIKDHPAAMALLNNARSADGARPLK
ncbi:hypothetical protein PHYC_02885 [Phycisphaerales bacterium]|nr:hypothetical protein PHYC_02885 [Phycisphaerales bacterium]